MIKLQEIRKAFGDRIVLNGVSLSVQAGEVYGLLGPNGAGKTTTINILCGFLSADEGTVVLNGQSISSSNRHLIGLAPQDIVLYDSLTCEENLRFFGKLYGNKGIQLNDRVDRALRLFELEPYRRTKVSNLSGGWKRRVNTAVAEVHAPQTLILDEPTAGLDIETRQLIRGLITRFNAEGKTIILTTHDLNEAEKLCSRIGILADGRIVAEGEIEALRRRIPAEEIAYISADDERAICSRATEIGLHYRHYGGKLALLLPKKMPLQELAAKLDGFTLRSILIEQVNLEHVFWEVSGDLVV